LRELRVQEGRAKFLRTGGEADSPEEKKKKKKKKKN